MLDLDEQGVSAFGRAMQDPEVFTQAAFWLLNQDKISEEIPLGRVGEPTDVANAYLYLASDLASYVTGEILQVDGAARAQECVWIIK